MSITARHFELVNQAQKATGSAQNPIEKLRAQCLSRGATGIHGLSRFFKIMDDNGDKRISLEEFRNGLRDYGLFYTREEVNELFNHFDKDKSGSINFDEFLVSLRPPMNKSRMDLINRAFNKLDKDKDGTITSKDLKGVYNVSKHPKYLNGEWTEEQVFRRFLDAFDTKGQEDGVITRDEFISYYAGVSASIDSDAYFDLMMKNSWKI